MTSSIRKVKKGDFLLFVATILICATFLPGIVRAQNVKPGTGNLEIKETETEMKMTIQADSLFDSDKSDIKKTGEPVLYRAAVVIKRYPNYPNSPVLVEGYTDSKGSETHNQQLSERHAASVKDWLVKKGGLYGRQIETKGWGSAKPVAPNTKSDGSDNPEGRQKNRRIEIVVKKEPTPAAKPPPTQTESENHTKTPLPGEFAIQGTNEARSDVTVRGKESFVHTKIHQIARFTAESLEGNRMKGHAQITYIKDYEIASPRCKTAWSTGEVSWSDDLNGTFQKKEDGSVIVFLLPTSMQGPGIVEDYLCLGTVTEYPVVPGVVGTLVNGKFDTRKDLKPAGSGDVTGFSWWTVHIEQVPNK